MTTKPADHMAAFLADGIPCEEDPRIGGPGGFCGCLRHWSRRMDPSAVTVRRTPR